MVEQDFWERAMKDSYFEAVISLYHWQHTRSNCFSDLLFDLFKKADRSNKAKLAAAFPYHAAALDAWDNAGDGGNDLFRRHNIGRFSEAGGATQ